MTKKTTKDNMNCVLYQKSQLSYIKVLFSTLDIYSCKRFLHPLYDMSGMFNNKKPTMTSSDVLLCTAKVFSTY